MSIATNARAFITSLRRYAVALLSVGAVLVVRMLLQPVLGSEAPLLLFTLSVMVSAWYGGLGPGLLATGLGALIGAYFFFTPIYSLAISGATDKVVLVLFILIGVLISLLNQALRDARRGAEQASEERAQLLARAEQARREAEESNRLKDEFLATVSHELRTPLASMLMWIRLLASDKLDAESSAQAHHSLTVNIKSLSHLIEDLLDASRIVNGKVRIEARVGTRARRRSRD